MRVLVTGGGQLAWELQRSVPTDVELITLPRAELDIASPVQVRERLDAIRPHAVINAAAYTAVDNAENDRDAAFAANCDGPRLLAERCRELGAYLLHLSTDFVFDGSANIPYDTAAAKNPVGVYGASKAAGEDAIAGAMSEGWAVIRTAWVYSSHGNNFVKTMLRLMATKPSLGVVGDQIGTPTWARGLARTCWAAVGQQIAGIYHWTDAGVASWYDFAAAIQRIGLAKGLLASKIPLASIATADYPTPARRPAYSVLDKSKILQTLPIEAHHWQDQLALMLAEIAAQH